MNRNFLTLLGLSWGLSIAVAFYFGRSAANQSSGIEAERPIKTSSQSLADPKTTDRPAELAGTESMADLPETEEPVETDPIALRESILSNIVDLSNNPQLADTLRKQLAELAKTSPIEALELSSQIPSPRFREQATNGVLREWAGSDPMSALQWIDANSDGLTRSVRNEQLIAAYAGFAQNNLQAALLSAGQLGEANSYELRIKSRIMGDMIRTQAENSGVVAAKQSIEQMPDSEIRNRLITDLIDVWAGTSPTEAAAYISSLGDNATEEQKRALARSWARNDPAAAASWIDTLDPSDPASSRATRDIIREWARYDLNSSAEWLNSRPASPEMDRAIGSYTYHAVQEDPASAMEWATSVDSEGMKDYLQKRVAGAWREEDPVAFQNYLDSSELSDERKTELQEARSWGSWQGRWGRR